MSNWARNAFAQADAARVSAQLNQHQRAQLLARAELRKAARIMARSTDRPAI